MEIWNSLTFEDVQSVFLEWQIHLNWIIENGGEYYSESSQKNRNLLGTHSKDILSARLIYLFNTLDLHLINCHINFSMLTE
jgi:hypothetical protein